MGHGRKFKVDVKVPLDALPPQMHERVGPTAPEAGRRMAARALLPAEPLEMVTILAYLAADDDDEISKEATHSLRALPENILLTALASALPPQVLSACASRFLENEPALEAVALNRETTDEAIAYIASNAEGRVLDIVADNQVRLLRHPEIVEALYFNPNTSTGTAVRAIETAARGGIDLSHVPGYREIAASIMGETRPEEAAKAAPEEAPGAETPAEAEAEQAPAEEASPPMQEPEGVDDALFGAFVNLGEGQEMSDELFDQMLRVASESEEEGLVGDEIEARASNVLWKIIRDMTLPQKVRLALMGNAAARAILVRDTKKMVSMAVLRSPGLTDREIANFAANKTLSDDIIRAIAQKRDWLKNYSTRLSLVKNPKCPPAKALNILSTLREKDMRLLTRDKEIPAYLSRQAKNILEKRTRKSGR